MILPPPSARVWLPETKMMPPGVTLLVRVTVAGAAVPAPKTASTPSAHGTLAVPFHQFVPAAPQLPALSWAPLMPVLPSHASVLPEPGVVAGAAALAGELPHWLTATTV